MSCSKQSILSELAQPAIDRLFCRLCSMSPASTGCTDFVCSDWVSGRTCRRMGRFARMFGPHLLPCFSQALHFSPFDQSLPVGRHWQQLGPVPKNLKDIQQMLGHVHASIIAHLHSFPSTRFTLLHLSSMGHGRLFPTACSYVNEVVDSAPHSGYEEI